MQKHIDESGINRGVNSETDLHPCHIYPSEALGLTRCKQSMPLGVSADKNAATSYSTAKYGIDRSGTINLPVRLLSLKKL